MKTNVVFRLPDRHLKVLSVVSLKRHIFVAECAAAIGNEIVPKIIINSAKLIF